MGDWDLRRLGELGLIERLRRGAGVPRGWQRGIGDDAAVLRPRRGFDLATTVDALVEERLGKISERMVGRGARRSEGR